MWRTSVAVEKPLLGSYTFRVYWIVAYCMFFSFNSLFWLGTTTKNLWSILHFVSLFLTKSNFNWSCGIEITGVAFFKKSESEGSRFFKHAEVGVVLRCIRSRKTLDKWSWKKISITSQLRFFIQKDKFVSELPIFFATRNQKFFKL